MASNEVGENSTLRHIGLKERGSEYVVTGQFDLPGRTVTTPMTSKPLAASSRATGIPAPQPRSRIRAFSVRRAINFLSQ